MIIEFESVEQAIGVHQSRQYQASLKELEGGAIRDIRIAPGLD